MLRRALTYQLILAVAVGPLLCCCTVEKAFAGATATPSHSATSPLATQRVSHACCSHKHVPAKPESEKPASSNPGHPTDKCPCKDGSEKPQTLQADPTQTTLSTFLRAIALEVPVPFISLIAVETLSEAGSLDCRGWPGHALLSTDELLYAHHNLRC